MRGKMQDQQMSIQRPGQKIRSNKQLFLIQSYISHSNERVNQVKTTNINQPKLTLLTNFDVDFVYFPNSKASQ